MKLSKAWAIFKNINDDFYSDEEKGMAIYAVCNAETHNSIRKDELLDVIRWLLPLAFELPEEQDE